MALVGLPMAAMSPASAAPAPPSPTDFDAPLFGTTATLNEGRTPTYQQDRCSDTRCTHGVLTVVEVGATIYVSTNVSRGGVFAETPFFVAKLNNHWTNFAANSQAAGGRSLPAEEVMAHACSTSAAFV